jgi:predicted nucleic acid-binding protein
MKIYLDMCSLQRPLDDKVQLRILVEAEAVLGIIALCDSGEADLIGSEALVFEAEQNPHSIRKKSAYEMLSKAREIVLVNEQVEKRARSLKSLGIGSMDALHLASAIEAGADYFCTCDDKLLRRAKAADTESTKVVSPLELIAELEP